MPPSRPSSSLFPSLFPAERWNIPSQARIGYTFADFLRCGKRGNLTLLIRRHPPVPYQHSPSFQGKQLVLPAWLRLGEFQALETQREDFDAEGGGNKDWSTDAGPQSPLSKDGRLTGCPS